MFFMLRRIVAWLHASAIPCRHEFSQSYFARRSRGGVRADHHSSAQPAEIPEGRLGGNAVHPDERGAQSTSDAGGGFDSAGAALPAFKNSGADFLGQAKVTAVIIIDNSESMAMSDGTMTRFEKARKAAEQSLESMPAGSSSAILLASDVVNGVITEPTFDFNLARKAIREAPLTDRSTDLLPAVQQALDTLKQRIGIRKEIYLVTDGQLAGWKQMGEIQKLLEGSQRDIRSHVVFVSEHEERNLAVTDLRNASGLSPVKQPIRFEVRVSNFGRDEVRNTRVSLSADNEAPSDEFTIDSLPPGGSKNVSLFAKLRTEGFHSVVARIPEDRLAADDKRTLVVHAINEVRVLFR